MAPSPALLRADTLVRGHRLRQLRSSTRGSGHRCYAFGFVQKMLSSQQCTLLQRTEVPLEPRSVPSSHPFRVATFNILADGLAQTGDFVKVPISCLQWEYRLPMILQEVRAANADIICLQELNHFDALAAALIPEGYSAFFRAKQPSPALKFGFPADGIALFYRHSRFSCFPEPEGHCFESMDGQPAAQGYVTAQLHDKQSGRCLVVAATHLKAKAGVDNEQTRVHQACQLLLEVEHMLDRHQQLQQQQQQQQKEKQLMPFIGNGSNNNSSSSSTITNAQHLPPAVLLCGDFNTTPDSDTAKYIKQHDLELGSIWDVSRSGPTSNSNPMIVSGNGNGKGSSTSSSNYSSNGNGKHPAITQQVEPPTPAAAAAAAAAGCTASSNGNNGSSSPKPEVPEGQEEFTTWKFRSSGVAKRTIDFIWYSKQQLVPTSRWCMLSEAEIGPEGLPSRHYPSDHMCVTCQFAWKDQ